MSTITHDLTIKYADGSEETFSGDPANQLIPQLSAWANGSTQQNGAFYDKGEDKACIAFRCLCAFEYTTDTKLDPDRDCDSIRPPRMGKPIKRLSKESIELPKALGGESSQAQESETKKGKSE
ncbi:hypothetical protein FACS189418_6830 [Clostridia bacterium]|nr:hypothetical protein FACS189418_6830 [Clostridia bacterium]